MASQASQTSLQLFFGKGVEHYLDTTPICTMHHLKRPTDNSPLVNYVKCFSVVEVKSWSWRYSLTASTSLLSVGPDITNNVPSLLSMGPDITGTGSSPVEVLNFFQASLRNCKNCDHNCEDHSSFDFISAVHI